MFKELKQSLFKVHIFVNLHMSICVGLKQDTLTHIITHLTERQRDGVQIENINKVVTFLIECFCLLKGFT